MTIPELALPEEAVKAAVVAMNTGDMVSYDSLSARQSADARRILTAALPFLPVQGAVKVKALDWGKSSVSELDKAQTVVGSYFISNHAVDAHNLMFDNDQITALLSVHTSLEAAKAAAQSDFAARILSTLEPSTARELALEALRSAEQFIENGFEFGFIRKPDEGDPALETLPKIKAAIRALSSPDHAYAGKTAGVKLPTERVCIPDPHNPDARIVGFRIREGDDAWGETGLSEPIFWLNKLLTADAGKVEGDGIERAKFYHHQWPMERLLAARRDGLVDHSGGEAWRYEYSHKDEHGKYDILYRPVKNSTIPARLPSAPSEGAE